MKYPRLLKKNDKRIKISKRSHIRIRRLFFGAGYSFKEIGEQYGVTDNAIRWIIYPKQHNQNTENWRKRYSRKKHRLRMRKHRAMKNKAQREKILKYRQSKYKRSKFIKQIIQGFRIVWWGIYNQK